MGKCLVKIMKLKENATIPSKATVGSAGMDLTACIDEEITIPSNETVKIPTGIAISIPKNFVALIYARSGLAIKQGLSPANCVGVVDSDYRGEIIVALHNHSKNDYVVKPNERVAQMVISEIPDITVTEVESLDETLRGSGGFGSTGKM